jgi:hypothetical protein
MSLCIRRRRLDRSRHLREGRLEGGVEDGKEERTYGRGIEMTTSYRVICSFSSSYSMLTSHEPSLVGEGQQLTE